MSARLPAKVIDSRLLNWKAGGWHWFSDWCWSIRAFDSSGQVTKGAWGMSWRQEALKGVEDCDKLGETVKRVMIPRYPNWHTLNP